MQSNKIRKWTGMGIGILLSMVLLTSPLSVNAQGDALLPSGQSISEISKLIDTMTDESVAEATAGGAVRISIDGENVFRRDFGYADKENNIAVGEETVFEWGTVSQLLIWVSVLQLEEDGIVNMQENIANYLPEGDLKDELEPMCISMENLMNYNSGLQDNLAERMIPEGMTYSSFEETLNNTIPEQIYNPGSVVSQSDWPCALAAYIVEYMSGVSYAEYVKENIFTPLEMEHTALAPDLSDNEWVKNARQSVQSYQGDMLIVNNFYHMPLYPAGMVTGTIGDLHIFANELLVQDADSRLFDKEETAKSMFEATLQYAESEEDRIAHGMFIYRFQVPVYGMKGNSMTQMAVVYMEPESKTCFTYMSNAYNELSMISALETAVFGTPQYIVKEDLSGLRVFEGTYVPGNAIVDGKLRFTSVLSAMYVTLNDSRELVLPMFADEVFMNFVDEEHGLLSNGTLVNIHDYPDGTTVIMTPNQDYVTYSTFLYFAQIGIFLAMLFAYFYSNIALILALFDWIMAKVNKKKTTPNKFTKYHVIQCINTSIFGVYFAYMAIMSMSYAPATIVKTASVMFWLGSIMSLIYLLFFWKTGKEAEVEKKLKVLYWATAVAAVITIAFAALFGLIL